MGREGKEEKTKSADIAERLRLLQNKRGITVQEMADRCGLPKSSLVNYMSLKDPQRPGVDALIALANGLGASVDWIIGRTSENAAVTLTQKDYAFACHSIVISVLSSLLSIYERDPEKAIQPGKVMGHYPHEIAALAMLDFVSMTDGMAARAEVAGDMFKLHFDSLSRMATEETGSTSFRDFADREP